MRLIYLALCSITGWLALLTATGFPTSPTISICTLDCAVAALPQLPTTPSQPRPQPAPNPAPTPAGAGTPPAGNPAPGAPSTPATPSPISGPSAPPQQGDDWLAALCAAQGATGGPLAFCTCRSTPGACARATIKLLRTLCNYLCDTIAFFIIPVLVGIICSALQWAPCLVIGIILAAAFELGACLFTNGVSRWNWLKCGLDAAIAGADSTGAGKWLEKGGKGLVGSLKKLWRF